MSTTIYRFIRSDTREVLFENYALSMLYYIAFQRGFSRQPLPYSEKWQHRSDLEGVYPYEIVIDTVNTQEEG